MALALAGSASAQWNEEGNLMLPEHTQVYDQQTTIDANGSMWTWFYTPSGGDNYKQMVQCVKPDGNLAFGMDGKEVCNTRNMSWTTCNQTVMGCSDGSIITVAVDQRDQTEETGFLRSYYAYRMDKDGNNLWGEDGILLNVPVGNAGSPTHMSICELPNGNVVFAWQEDDMEQLITRIGKQCITPDGKKLYTDKSTMQYSESKLLVWPTVVSDGEGGYFILYGRTDYWYLYVQHFDADGVATWNSGFSITRKSEWSGMPMWFLVDAIPSADGGILVYWRDSRDYGPMYPYVACIDKEGNSKFVNATGTADCRVIYTGRNATGLSAALSPDGKGYLLAITEEDSNSAKMLSVQKVSNDSELLYDEYGKVIFEEEEMLVENAQLIEAPGDKIALMYVVRNLYDIDSRNLRIELLDPETGDKVSEEPLFQFMPWSEIGNVSIMSHTEGSYWMLQWQDAGPKGDKHYDGYQNQIALRVNFDGTIGAAEDGVNVVEVNETAKGMYNLQGQRITNGKGIIIANGKKYILH